MWFLVFLGTVFHILGILSAIEAVYKTRTSQGTIAWGISLLTFPVVSVPLYWVLGRSRFKGYSAARKQEDEEVLAGLDKFNQGLEPYMLNEAEIGGAGHAAEKLAELPFLKGNKVDLLVDGDATFESIEEGISSAKAYVLFQFFIINDDELGRRMKKALEIKAKEGVRVYVLYDEVGSHTMPQSYRDDLIGAGAEILPFNTRKGKGNRFQLNFRNHRKNVVVDGKVTWIGGHNVGDEYMGKDPKFGHWRDTHVRIQGPSVLGAQLAFCEDWNWAADEMLSDLNWKPEITEGASAVLVVPTSPADELESAALMFHHAINSAKKRIWIASPYFVPDDSIVAALQLAGLRGVDVRILIPDQPDHLLVYLAAFTYFEDASKTGCRVFRYTDGFLHQKTMLIDDVVSGVGTANFDNRSFRLNFEITSLIADPDFAKKMEAMFENDFAHSREMTMADVNDKKFLFKLMTRFARLTSPVQ